MSKFDEIKQTFEEKLAKVREEITATEAKIVQLTKDYAEAVQDFAFGGGKLAANSRAYAKAASEKSKAQLSDLMERADVLETMRLAKLREAFPELAEENRQAIQAVYDEYEQAGRDLLRLRAETLLKLQRLWLREREAHSIHSITERAAREAGIEFKGRVAMPSLNLFGQYGSKDSWLLPLSQEASLALHQGELPYFVKLYELTGELIEEGKANQRLREMKEANKNGK